MGGGLNMYIVDYERGEVANIDNATSIYVDEKRIYAVTTVRDILLGEYDTPDRAKEVFKEMLEMVFPPNTFVCQNCEMSDLAEIEKQAMKTPLFIQCQGDATIQRFDIGVYYMPEQ